jgi:predicted nuclease of predicted toxin-antitoxin system
MRLLFDENLSPRLVARLADLFPGSAHVVAEGVGGTADGVVWQHAARNGFIIVSKDEDFHHLAFLRGAPPKVIGLQLGNCTTDEIEAVLRAREVEIRRFAEDSEAVYLALRRA